MPVAGSAVLVLVLRSACVSPVRGRSGSIIRCAGAAGPVLLVPNAYHGYARVVAFLKFFAFFVGDWHPIVGVAHHQSAVSGADAVKNPFVKGHVRPVFSGDSQSTQMASGWRSFHQTLHGAHPHTNTCSPRYVREMTYPAAAAFQWSPWISHLWSVLSLAVLRANPVPIAIVVV